MADLLAHAYHITVGPPAPDAVPADRQTFYKWLVPVLASRRRCKLAARNINVTNEEMKSNPAIIQRSLNDDSLDDDGKKSVVVIDLAENPYHLIRDIFLYHVADVAQRWIDSRPKQTVVMLLPGGGLPPPASLFWYPMLEGADTQRLLVVANDGTIWPEAQSSMVSKLDYVRQRNRSKKSLIEQLEMRIVRKPGHYDFGSSDEAHCTRYFFETEQAEQEIGELIVEWVEHTLRPRLSEGEPLTLVSHGKQSASFHDAVAGAATALGCAFRKLNDDGSLPDPIELSGWVAPIFNVVNTGGIYQRVLRALSIFGASVTQDVLAVMVMGEKIPVEPEARVRLSSLCGPYNREKVEREKCVQCQLGLPHTPARIETQIGIRAFDMWSILLEAGWGREQFGAPPRQQYAHLPDLGRVFSRHGNYFAYKVHYLLKNLGADREVAFVCPEEANVEQLVTCLGVLLQNRQVAVRVPPAVIRGRNWNQEAARRRNEGWHRQLRHLHNQHFSKTVIIDEIAGSKLTAEGLVRLLRSFDLEPFAFVPIIDFSPGRPLQGVPTYPLYRIPYPRGEHG
jgi:hypothetical protein